MKGLVHIIGDRVYENGMLGKRGSNQYIKAKEFGLDPPLVSKETRLKLSEKSKYNSIKWFSNPENKEKHRLSMREAVKKYPKSYTASNRGRTKQIEKYGVKFQGKWEFEFFEYCIDSEIEIERNETGFPYQWNGERLYFPDFYLPKLKLFVEVKGYETERDRAKWRDFPFKLKVIRVKEINQIRNQIPLCLGTK
jgi:hypothetical protein